VGYRSEYVKSEEGGGCLGLQRHSQSCKGANQEATELTRNGILSYGSDLVQEPGLAPIFESLWLCTLNPQLTTLHTFPHPGSGGGGEKIETPPIPSEGLSGDAHPPGKPCCAALAA